MWECVQAVTADLEFPKVWARWVARMLFSDGRQNKWTITRQFVVPCGFEGDGLLSNVVTTESGGFEQKKLTIYWGTCARNKPKLEGRKENYESSERRSGEAHRSTPTSRLPRRLIRGGYIAIWRVVP